MSNAPAPVHLLVGRRYFYVVILCVVMAQYLIVIYGIINTETGIVGALIHHPIGLAIGMWAIGRINVNPPNVRDHRAGPSDPSKAGPSDVAGSGASSCWADLPDQKEV